MNKIEIFLPLPNMTKELEDYFTRPSVFYLGGLPVGPEIPSNDLTEAELIDYALDVAQNKIDTLTMYSPEAYTADSDYPFIAPLLNSAGEQIAWEFEFSVNETY